MERGFKSYAEELAAQLRQEMKIPAHDRLCAFQLSEYLGVPTLKFSDLLPLARDQFGMTNELAKALDAEVHGLCIPHRAGRAILYNDNRPAPRQQSDVAHEASHILLGHPLADIVSGAVGTRTKEYEDEAATLSGAILLPRAAAIHVLREKMSVTIATEYYGVSEQMLSWRCNVSGARAIVARKAGGSRH
jgi:Zn-dependent peptidase ImmA (M78 family)